MTAGARPAVLRVALLGAESTGKSALAAALAARYCTAWVPEYLRAFVEQHGRVPRPEEQSLVAATQQSQEDIAARLLEAGSPYRVRPLFCDTTPLMTALYSDHCFGARDPETAALVARHDYALTLVTAPDIPWQADGLQRDGPEARSAIHERLLAELEQRRIGYHLVGGDLATRTARVEELLAPLLRG